MEAQEKIGRRIHNLEKALVALTYEGSPINCTWDELPQGFKNLYLQQAVNFVTDLEELGYRKPGKLLSNPVEEAELAAIKRVREQEKEYPQKKEGE